MLKFATMEDLWSLFLHLFLNVLYRATEIQQYPACRSAGKQSPLNTLQCVLLVVVMHYSNAINISHRSQQLTLDTFLLQYIHQMWGQSNELLLLLRTEPPFLIFQNTSVVLEAYIHSIKSGTVITQVCLLQVNHVQNTKQSATSWSHESDILNIKIKSSQLAIVSFPLLFLTWA